MFKSEIYRYTTTTLNSSHTKVICSQMYKKKMIFDLFLAKDRPK